MKKFYGGKQKIIDENMAQHNVLLRTLIFYTDAQGLNDSGIEYICKKDTNRVKELFLRQNLDI